MAEISQTIERSERKSLRAKLLGSPAFAVAVAFAIRIVWILVAHTYRLKTHDDNFSFGFEMGRIGRSLVEGQGFSNPFDGQTGPTAWEPPLYPFLIAFVFKFFGVYTRASAFVLLTINSFFSALTCIPIFRIARRVFGEKSAMWSMWLWVVLPNFIFWCTRWIWETSLAALLLTVLFWLTLELVESGGSWPWVRFGLVWGVAALINTSLLGFLPASGLWVWYRRAKAGRRSVGGVMAASLVFVACVTPWVIRNHQVLGQFIFVRSNFGAELRLGNGPGAVGKWMDYEHPSKDKEQLRMYAEMGELPYVAMRKREAVEFIREDWGRFAQISLRRVEYFWTNEPQSAEEFRKAPLKRPLVLVCSLAAFAGLGMAFWKRRPEAWLFLWLFVSFPLVYYFVFTHPRYRHPMEPEMLVVIVAAVCRQPSAVRKN